jgi:uncharacterized protein YkwD
MVLRTMTIVLQDDDEHFGPKIIRNATVTSTRTDSVLEPTFARPQPRVFWLVTPLRGTLLTSRRNLLATLTLMVVMGCQQSDTVVHTGDPAVEPVRPAAVPFVEPAGEDHPTAQGMFASAPATPIASPLPTAPVWTSQALLLDVLPGSPAPVRQIVVTQAAPEPVAAEYKPTTTRAASATAAPTTTAAPAPAAAPAPTAPPPVAPAAATVSNAPAAAADLFARTNGVRASRGVAALARVASLDSAAAGWARELATSGVLRHSTLPQQLIGKPWSTLGENVGYGASSATIHDALVNSAGHLANIVGPAFTRVGVGAATDVNGRLWVVELFAG